MSECLFPGVNHRLDGSSSGLKNIGDLRFQKEKKKKKKTKQSFL